MNMHAHMQMITCISHICDPHITIYSADEDYDSDVIEVTFNPGDTRMTISINITDDSIDEEDEAFALDLTTISAMPDTLQIAGPTTAFGIIEDNDDIGMYDDDYKFI